MAAIKRDSAPDAAARPKSHTAHKAPRWLYAGVSFMNDVRDGQTLRAWVTHHLFDRGLLVGTSIVQEPTGERISGVTPIGELGLDSAAAGRSFRVRLEGGLPSDPLDGILAIEDPLGDMLDQARSVVADALDGFLFDESDRFLLRAIHQGDVSRTRHGGWAPTPKSDRPLSAIVLSLFGADLLAHPQAWRRELSMCSACYAMWFGQRGCPHCNA